MRAMKDIFQSTYFRASPENFGGSGAGRRFKLSELMSAWVRTSFSGDASTLACACGGWYALAIGLS